MVASRRLTAIGVVTAVLMTASIVLAQQPRVRSGLSAATYFPLADGNTWLYGRLSPSAPATWRVTATAVAGDATRRPAFTLAGYFFGAPRQVTVSAGDRVTERDPYGNRDTLWYLLGARPGTIWELRLVELPIMAPERGCISGSWLSVSGRDETVTVPAGEFRHVVRVEWRPPCADAGITTEWFAPGVGLIRREETTFAGPLVSELLQARVGDRVYPAAGYQTSLALAAPVAVNNLMPGVGPQPLPIVSGAFTVANATEIPLELTFTGCRSLTLTVTDAEGKVVLTTRADDGGCCACDSIERLVLVRDSLVLPFSFPLGDEQGEHLQDGLYSIAATLDTVEADTLRPAARARIEVQSVY